MGIVGTGLSASFQYDPSGRRVQKIVNGQPTEFLSDGVNPLQEQAVAGGNWTALMMLGLGVDEVLARADTSGVHYFLPDALGSTVFLTDAFGVTEAEYSYAPFGETTRTGTVTTNPFQFTGRENDNTGLYYYRARYYHPVLQRFLSEDPLEFLGGDLNLYAYVANNPILDVDPFGTT
ncbi:MAG: RHS repeat-associated core domain-containing protein, partial [Candidatus Binatia bacterium]